MEPDDVPQSPWASIRERMHKHLVPIIAVAISVLICTGIIISAAISSYQIQNAKTVTLTFDHSKTAVEAVKYYSPLTGSIIASEAATKLPVTGMMIENSSESRPQSGLKSSGVVFEAIAEGGITRFLVLYQNERPSSIGPVRSLRLYDVDWLAAFDAGIGHVGGSAAALSEIRNGNYRDLDQFFNSGFYWRASDRYAPHNVYTNFDKIDALNAQKGITTSNFTGFSRINGKASDAPTASTINVVVSSALFNSSYIYDKTTNTYARSQAGAAHLDREEGQITPSVVITLHVDETTVLEDGYRESIQTIGSGVAEIFQNGVVIKATWHKDSKLAQLYFTDEAGKPISLVRGQTWITAVPNDGGGVSWQ